MFVVCFPPFDQLVLFCVVCIFIFKLLNFRGEDLGFLWTGGKINSSTVFVSTIKLYLSESCFPTQAWNASKRVVTNTFWMEFPLELVSNLLLLLLKKVSNLRTNSHWQWKKRNNATVFLHCQALFLSLSLSFFSFRSDCMELDFKEISYLVSKIFWI